MSLGVVTLIARLALAAVFALAALTKLGRREETESTLEAFGFPIRLRPPVAVGLPVVELAIAAALLPASSAPYAAVAALLLLAAFSVAVARTLARGEEVDCNCFGSLGEGRVSRWTLVRDLVLMVPAGFVVATGWSDPGPSAVAWVGNLDASAAALTVAGVALAVAALGFAFGWQLMRQNGRLLERLEALEGSGGGALTVTRPKRTGKPVPSFALPDLSGRDVTLEGLLAEGRELLLVFSDPGCHACNPVLPEVGRRQREADTGPLPVVMSLGDVEENRVKASAHGLELVLLQDDFELARALGVSGMPGAVLVGRDGRIAAEPVEDTERVAALLAATSPPPPASPEATLRTTAAWGRR